jgi:glycosyltransferase involved in cell wall biosynthesis
VKILINAVNLKVGGGVTVVSSFLKELIANEEFHGDTFHVLVPSGIGYEKFDSYPVKIETVPNRMLSPLFRLILDYTWFKDKIAIIQPDIIFTMGNIAIPSIIPQAVLFHFPYAMYPDEKEVWTRLSKLQQFDFKLRNLIFSSRLKYAKIIFPQTDSARFRLKKYYGNKIQKFKVIPNSTYRLEGSHDVTEFFSRQLNCKYLLCLSKYYSHKNIEIFVPLAKLIKEKNSSLRLVITIEGDQGSGSQELIDAIAENKLTDIIINIGKVPMDQVPALYRQVDGMIMPTLLESFSATYIDSMTLGVPIFTSDRDFARDVCGDAAWYFDPHNAEKIFNTISTAFAQDEQRNEKVSLGKKLAESMPDWKEVTQMYVEALHELVDSKNHVRS